MKESSSKNTAPCRIVCVRSGESGEALQERGSIRCGEAAGRHGHWSGYAK